VAIYLVRHGEDLAAANERFGNEGLSSKGQEQARSAGKQLASVEFSRCLVSPLERARETASLIIGERLISQQVEAVLAEGSAGELAGVSIAEARERYPRYFQRGDGLLARIASSGMTAPGGESRDEFLARAAEASELIRKSLDQDENLLVVAHGGLLNYGLQHMLGIPPRDDVPFGFDNCGVVRLLSWTGCSGLGVSPRLRFSSP